MPLIKPNIPPLPPQPPRPKPHFGDEGTPTPISSKFPQSSSAGSTINPGGPSHPRGPLSLRGSVVGNTGHTDPIPSPLPLKRPGSPELPNDRFKVTEQQVQAYDGKKRPDLTDYFAKDGSKIQDLRKDSDGNLYFIDEHDYSFRAEFYEDDITHVMIYDPYGVNNTIFLRLFNDGRYRQVESWLPESSPSSTIANVGTPSPQSGPSTASKHPLPPDGVQSLPSKRSRYQGGIKATEMPQELIPGSGGFWGNKGPVTRQMASNLFQNGKIRDVTYSNGGKDISGKFDYMGKEYQFFFSREKNSRTVTFQDMDGNKVPLSGIKGRSFGDFLRIIGGTPALLEGGIKATEMPPELTNGSGNFWKIKSPVTRQLANNLFRSGKIRDVTYSNGGKEIRGEFDYMGREYQFFFPEGSKPTVAFQDMDGNKVLLNGIKGRSFGDFLYVIGERPVLRIEEAPVPPRLPIMLQNMPYNFRIPNELNPPAAGKFWGTADTVDNNTQFLLTELYRNGEIYGIDFGKGLYGNDSLSAVMRYQGRDYSFSVGINHQVTFPSTDVPPVFHNKQPLFDILYILAGQTLP